MSRCHPFPPPGYVKNAPLELELLSKKEKHKHKDKKKKRKKLSTTNGDLISKEDDRHCTYIEQSGQSCKRLCEGSQKLPSATVNEGIIKGLQIKSFVDDAVFNCEFATDPERDSLRLRSREESRSKSMLSADRLQGESSRSQPSKSVHSTDSCQSFQGVNPVLEGLSGGCLAIASKRLKLDTPTSLSNHVPVVSGHKMPEQADNSKSLTDVFSTNCKRLQAKHAAFSDGENHLLLREAWSSDCKKYDALHTGSSRTDVLMYASNGSATVQAGFSKNASISKNRLPTDVRRSEKKPRADQSSSKPRTNGSFCKVGQAQIGKDRDVPHFLLENRCFFEKEKSKPEMETNGAEATNFVQMKMNSSTVQKTLNGMQTTICDKSLQSERLLMMNSQRRSSMIDSPANRVNEVCSVSLASSNLDDSKQNLHNAANGIAKASSNAKEMLLELDCTKQEVSAHATSEKRSHRQDLKMQYIKDKADKTHNRHVMLVNSYGNTDSRLQVDALENSVTSSCVLAGNQHSKVGSIFTTPASAANGDNREAHSNAIYSRTIALNFEDKMMKKLSNLRIPQPEQAWVTNSEHEDWLVSYKQQLQSEEGGKVKEAESQQVWAEAVLLREVGLTALPFVVLN